MKLALFAGTTEGRHIAMVCDAYGINCTVFVATPQGCEGLDCLDNIELREGRLDRDEIARILKNEGFTITYDATHPFAVQVTDNIRAACEAVGCEYIRVIRESVPVGTDTVIADSFESVVDMLNLSDGNVLVTTGSKNAADYTKVKDFADRLYLRILPDEDMTERLCEMGYRRNHIITGKGPFSEDENINAIRWTNSSILVTKDSGRAGGLAEKLSAAEKCGCKVILIRRPEEEGIRQKEAINKLINDSGREKLLYREAHAGMNKGINEVSNEKIYIIGFGMGAIELISAKSADIIRSSSLVIGASRIIDECLREGLINDRAKTFKHYNIDLIAEAAEKNAGLTAILMSGDTGFYSGAKGLAERLGERAVILPGISSLSYMSAKTGIAWEDAYCISAHGRRANIALAVRTHRKTFVLTDGAVGNIMKHLREYYLGAVKVYIGHRLSYPDERITEATPDSYDESDTDSLQSLLIINDSYENRMRFIPDSEFLRNTTPMTKESVRNMIISMLSVNEASVIYDIGAGTGSVTVMLSRLVPNGRVYSFEYKEKACEMINANIKKFSADNVEIVRGKAPESIKNALNSGIEKPDAVFVGGSEGSLKSILSVFSESGIEAVISCATIETIGQALELIKNGIIKDASIIQLSASAADTLGRYHIMRPETPVWLIKGVL